MSVLIEVLSFAGILLGINISLNLFYEIKRHAKILHYDYPFDLNLKFSDGHRILGPSATWGGLILVLILGIGIDTLWPGLYGLTKAVLVFLGHITGSFIKRRMGLVRGTYVPILDHGDYIILASVVFLSTGKVSIVAAVISTITILIISPLLTIASNKIGLREQKL